MKIFAVMTAVTALTTLSGCAFSERVCYEGQYPALFLEDGRLGGGTCVPQGQKPPPGYVAYPQDLEPVLLREQGAATEAFQARLDQQN